MARARNIKPGFFRNADLVELPMEARLLFIGLWTLADRSGRLEDRPKQIKMNVFPADSVDCDALIDQLAATGMVARYTVGGNRYLQVVNFEKHQNPHRDEKASTLPDQDGHIADAEPTPKKHSASTVQAPCNTGAATVAIGLTPDPRSLIPDSLIPETPTKKDNACRVAPFGVSDAVWEDFLKIRRAKKSPMTNTALAGIQREADAASVTLEAALKTCCERGWIGFKAAWLTNDVKTIGFNKPAPNITVPSRPGRDPELTRIDIERARAVPMPDAVRQQMEKIKFGVAA